MKSIVLKYGTISGIIASVLMFISVLIENKTGFGSTSMIIGYVGMALTFIPLYFGIKSFRQTMGNGDITFWKALNTGILIIVISAIFYTLSWLIIYYWVTPDYADKYCVYVVNELKATHSTQKVIDDATAEMAKMKEMCKNPFILAASTFPESLPMGIILTVICSLILRKEPPKFEISNLQ